MNTQELYRQALEERFRKSWNAHRSAFADEITLPERKIDVHIVLTRPDGYVFAVHSRGGDDYLERVAEVVVPLGAPLEGKPFDEVVNGIVRTINPSLAQYPVIAGVYFGTAGRRLLEGKRATWS